MTSMMEEVLRTGTAAGVRARYKFNVPAAGKTGTSHDGWFAGYTSELLCVVWVGFDDNRELDLEGAHSAAPIWAEFMKRALDFREYSDTKPFQAPDGIVTIDIDPLSGMPATPACPKVRPEVYIAGTAAGRPLPASWRTPGHHQYRRMGYGGARAGTRDFPACCARRAPGGAQTDSGLRGAPRGATDSTRCGSHAIRRRRSRTRMRRSHPRRAFSTASWVCLNRCHKGGPWVYNLSP